MEEVDLSRSWSPKNNIPLGEAITRGRYYWLCLNDPAHTWEASLAARKRTRVSTKSKGCPWCAGKKIIVGETNTSITHPHLVAEWSSRNTKTIDEVKTRDFCWWQCSANSDHVWSAKLSNRKHMSQQCPYCTKRLIAGTNTDRSPNLSELFSIDNNIDFDSAISSKKYKWVCKSDHIWYKTLSQMRYNPNCNYCTGLIKTPGINDIDTTHPHLREEWGKDNGVDIDEAKAKKAYSWVCKNGHTWVATLSYRKKVPECTYCTGTTLLVGYNDLETRHPELAKEWSNRNTLKPNQITPGSGYLAIWKCIYGHEWVSKVYQRYHGSKCPRCFSCTSTHEVEILTYIESNLGVDVKVESQSRKIIPPYELDIYIPSLKIAIEVNGVYWHSEKRGKDSTYHQSKWERCREKGIQLIQIWEDDWNNKSDVVKAMLSHKLGVSNNRRIFARKTNIVSVTYKEASAFLNKNHIQGGSKGSLYIGLEYEKTLVAVVVLLRQKNSYILNRYASSEIIIGGFSRLVKYIENNFTYDSLVTFANLEVSNGDLYRNTGWSIDKILKPDYMYLIGSNRVHKFNYRLNRFKRDVDLEYVKGYTEKQLADLNNISRVWDSGKIKFVKKHPKLVDNHTKLV